MNMINSNYRSINIFRPNSQIHPFIKQYWNLIMISILKYTDMNLRNFWWPTFGYNKILTRSLNHPSHHQSANSVDIDTLYCSCFVIICSLITVFCLLRKLWFTRRTLWHASSFKSLIRSIFSSIEGPKVNRQRDTKNTLMGFTVMLRRQHQLSL